MPEHPWFEPAELAELHAEEAEDADETDAPAPPDPGDERTFVNALRDHTVAWAGEESDEIHGRIDRAEEEGALVVTLSVSDPVGKVSLFDFGVHFFGDRVRGDRLHNQLGSLPEQPSAWALEASGSPDELGRRAARWLRSVLRRPIVLYVWLHKRGWRGDRYAYAARYLFADRDETLCQKYVPEHAPKGQPEELVAAGHVHGRGWIQTTGLPAPTVYLHIRGDLAEADLPDGVQATTDRGPIAGVWYE